MTSRGCKIVSTFLLCLLMFAVLSLAISHHIPRALASGDLIVNGGFETGDFKGWDADATCKVRPHSVKEQSYEPAHAGKYSARIGTENVKGSLSQTITIPEKSKAIISFWYRVEKGSTLDFYLRKADGSTIQRWGFQEESAWTRFNCEIDPQYAGKSIVLVFEGKGFLERTSEVVWVWDPSVGWIQLVRQVVHNYWPYIDDVSAVPEIAVYEVIVKISGLPSSLSTSIFVDGQEEHLRGEQFKTFQFTFGEHHEFRAKDHVYDGEEVRYVCKSNVETTSSDASITFDYTLQYLLTVESPYGEAEGSGWFDKDYTARFSMSPVTIPIEGFLGTLGAKYVFKGWIGDLTASSSSAEAKMDSPKRVTAVWEADYSNVYLILGGLGMTIAGLSFFMFFRRRGVKEEGEAKPPKKAEISKIGEVKHRMQIKVLDKNSGKLTVLEADSHHTVGSLVETVIIGLKLPESAQYTLKLGEREFTKNEFSTTLEAAGINAGDRLELVSKPKEAPEKIEEFKYCLGCGEKLPSDAEYCSRCGEKQE